MFDRFTHNAENIYPTFRFEWVSSYSILLNAKEYWITVELVELWLQEGNREGACKRGDTFSERRAMSERIEQYIYLK